MAKNQVNRSDSEWDEIIRQCKSSGMSDHQWCLDHGVSISTFYRRLRKFRNIQSSNDVPIHPVRVQEEPHAVVPLMIVEDNQERQIPDLSCGPTASIRFHGITIDLYQGTGTDVIQHILQMAVELC